MPVIKSKLISKIGYYHCYTIKKVLMIRCILANAFSKSISYSFSDSLTDGADGT